MRNAMAQYGAAEDDASRQEALNQVGVVSPDARAKLEKAWLDSNESQRKAIEDVNEASGSAAYMALQEPDAAKRQKIWDQYRSNLPESMRKAVPDTADEVSLKAVMAQSASARDTIMDLSKIAAQGEKQKDVAQYQGQVSMGLEGEKHGNRMTEKEKEFEFKRSLEDKKLLNNMTEKAAFQKSNNASGRNEFAALKYAADMGDEQAQQKIKEIAGLQAQQQGSVGYTYIPGKGLVPKQ